MSLYKDLQERIFKHFGLALETFQIESLANGDIPHDEIKNLINSMRANYGSNVTFFLRTIEIDKNGNRNGKDFTEVRQDDIIITKEAFYINGRMNGKEIVKETSLRH